MNNDTITFLKYFFEKDVPFFTQEVATNENEFMLRFRDAHTAWGGIRADPQIFGLNETLFNQLDKLFDEIFSYYCQIVSFNGTYNQAIAQSSQIARWSTIQKMASGVLKAKPNL